MSAILLWCALVIGSQTLAAYISRHGPDLFFSAQNKSISLSKDGTYIYNRNHKITVEEVDKNGNSVVKELELPAYDDMEELQEDRKRREQQEKIPIYVRNQNMYGCNNRRGNQRRKCLRRRKKLLMKRYKNWKDLIRRIIKDLDGKIKTLTSNKRKELTKENLNFMSGFSPRNVKRKKE